MIMLHSPPRQSTPLPPLNKAGAAGQVLLLTLALAGCSKPAAPETVWVGHLTALSGPRQAEGEQARKAIELALQPIHEKGELFEGRRVGVIYVDAARPEQARAEAARLLAVNGVIALLVGPGA